MVFGSPCRVFGALHPTLPFPWCEVAAIVYALIECCCLAKVNMIGYLSDVLVRVILRAGSRVASRELGEGSIRRIGACAPA